MAASIPWVPWNATVLAGPAGPAPPGLSPDIHVSNGHMVFVVCLQVGIGIVGAVALAAMRLFTQHFASHGIVLEDYVMLVALMFQLANFVICVLIVVAGIGRHMWQITFEQFFRASKLTWVFVTLYHTSVALVKVAILLQIRRIFGINKNLRLICQACIIINALVYVPSVFLNIFGCTPISGAWDRTKKGYCVDISALYKATGVYNIISNLVILAIPIPVVYRLKMSARRRWLITAAFATGITACVASIVRAVFTFRAFSSHDLSFNLLWMGLFCTYEVVFGILTYFTPLAGVFYKYVKSKLRELWPSKPLPEWQAYTIQVERTGTLPRRPPQLYNMPSLTSYEERAIKVQRTTTIEYMPALGEYNHPSSHRSNSDSECSACEARHPPGHSLSGDFGYGVASTVLSLSSPGSERSDVRKKSCQSTTQS